VYGCRGARRNMSPHYAMARTWLRLIRF
jgi:hypothetical protein